MLSPSVEVYRWHFGNICVGGKHRATGAVLQSKTAGAELLGFGLAPG